MKQHGQAESAFRRTKGDIAADRWRGRKTEDALLGHRVQRSDLNPLLHRAFGNDGNNRKR
jgi:hypothetical protein